MTKKKRVRKVNTRRQKLHPQYSRLIIVFSIVLLLLAGLLIKSFMSQENYRILGAKTLLAKGGDSDNSGSGSSGSGSSNDDSSDDNSGSGSSGSGSSGSSGGDSSGSGSSGSSGSGSGSSGSGSDSTSTSSGGSVSDSTKVLCTGPDGKQFRTEFGDCEELNSAWGTPVRFSVITSANNEVENEVEHEDEDEFENEQESELEHSTIRTRVASNEDEEKTEVRLSESERIRTRTKDGRTRIDITSGGIKTRYEIRDDRVIIKAELEDETEVELEDDTLLKIDDRLASDDIKIATAGAERLLVQRGNSGAVTQLPISVDLATNTLFANTPSGEKQLTVLPEQAIQNIIAANIVNRLGGRAVVDEANNNTLTSVSQLIALGERNGVPVYEINGISDQKLLGFIPVSIEKNIAVSAETGNAVAIEQPLDSRFLDALSF